LSSSATFFGADSFFVGEGEAFGAFFVGVAFFGVAFFGGVFSGVAFAFPLGD